MYKHCPKQFEFFYNSGDYYNYGESKGASPALIRGTAFHKGCDKFFNGFDVNYCKDLNSKQIGEYMSHHIQETNDDEINTWFSFFLEYEQRRFEQLREENKLQYYLPAAKELEISMPDLIDRTGHVDRIDQISEDELMIVEYKTGKSYDMDKPDRVTSMNAEIGFYVTILQGINKFPKQKIIKWCVINPTLEKVWINSISKVTLTSVDKNYKSLVEKLVNKEPFEKNINDLCMYCPYFNQCLYNKEEGLNIKVEELK